MKIIIITGQTATGKTAYALKLAQRYDGELVNADSRQIYKYLDIITGKDFEANSNITQKSKPQFNIQRRLNTFDIGYYSLPPTTYNQCTKLWLYDVVDPKQYFSSYDYVTCALGVINDILSRKKTPIIIGGTYLYLYHLLYDIATQSIKPDVKLREKLNNKNVEDLQKLYKQYDVQSFNQLNNSDRNNPRRLIRKIEILKHHKKNNTTPTDLTSFSTYNPITLSKKLGRDADIEYIGFHFHDKNKLCKKIRKRVEERIKNGAFQEVEKLLKQGYETEDPGMRTIGYNQIMKFQKGEISKIQAIENWTTKEIQYAKRQLVFMKKDHNIKWFSIS